MVKSGLRGIARRGPGGYGENRMLGSVSVRRNAVAEVVGRQPDPEKRSHTHRVNIAMRTVGGDGDLACSNPGPDESRAFGICEQKGGRGPGRRGNTRDRDHEIGSDSRKRVSVPRRWKAPRVEQSVSSSRWDDGSDLGVFGGSPRARAREHKPGTRQGCQRYGSIGSARKKNAVRQSEEAHRSEFGVVKRQVHRSPGRGCKPVGHGRGVSLEEMPVAHEARVLEFRKWEAEVGRTHRVSFSGASRKADHRRNELARSKLLHR